MGRPSHSRALNVWTNGRRVGEWRIPARGPAEFRYDADWMEAPETRQGDLESLLKSQLLFWMLAATDGHAKNFSIFLLAHGRYRLTPLYDVLSAWPVTGPGPNHLDYEKLRLAMAMRGRNAHYRLCDIQRRHFNDMARKCGLGSDMEAIIGDVVSRIPAVVEEVAAKLPRDFSARPVPERDDRDAKVGRTPLMAKKPAHRAG